MLRGELGRSPSTPVPLDNIRNVNTNTLRTNIIKKPHVNTLYNGVLRNFERGGP